jgi:hypothetical protein
VVDRVLGRVAGELVLAPSVDAIEAGARAEPFDVELRRPDGSRRPARAILRLPLGTASAPHALVRLVGVDERDVPKGTEVWTLA